MLKFLSRRTAARCMPGIATLGLIFGCDGSTADRRSDDHVGNKLTSSSTAAPRLSGNQNAGVIISRGNISVENGNVTLGRPQMTADVEKKIYNILSYHRNLAEQIEASIPGGNEGSRESRRMYEFFTKSYMVQYGLTQDDITAILQKGDAQGWK